jgi:UTP-glucose-1-phosphate uridylyltransferase
VIDVALEEVLEAGITQVCVIVNSQKESVVRHLQSMFGSRCSLSFVLREPAGFADSLLAVREFVGNDWFAVVLPDMISSHGNSDSPLRQLLHMFSQHNVPCVGVFKDDAQRFGKGDELVFEQSSQGYVSLKGLPHAGHEGKYEGFRIFGRYVLPPQIIDWITPGMEKETPLLIRLSSECGLIGVPMNGQLLDTGVPSGYERAREVLD